MKKLILILAIMLIPKAFAISLDDAKNLLQEEKDEYIIPLKVFFLSQSFLTLLLIQKQRLEKGIKIFLCQYR